MKYLKKFEAVYPISKNEYYVELSNLQYDDYHNRYYGNNRYYIEDKDYPGYLEDYDNNILFVSISKESLDFLNSLGIKYDLRSLPPNNIYYTGSKLGDPDNNKKLLFTYVQFRVENWHDQLGYKYNTNQQKLLSGKVDKRYGPWCYVNIHELKDDFFLVSITDSIGINFHYKCDQLDGLKKLLDDQKLI